MILDVDAAEIWTITALDDQGDLVDGVTFRAGDPNIDTGDGSVTPWSLGVGNTNEIVSVQLSGSGGLAGFFGFGWDNFTSTVLDEFFSDVVADITFSGDDFLNLSFAYLATDDSLSYDALERDTTFRHPYELLRYDEVQFGLQTVADYAEAMSTGLYPDDLSQTFEVLFPSLGGPAVDPATPLDQAEGMTTSLGDPPSIDDLLDALDGCESRMAVMSAAWFVEFRQRLPWLLHVD